MGKLTRILAFVMMIGAVGAFVRGPLSAKADTAADIDRDVDITLQKLYTEVPVAKEFSSIAKGILVFPSIVKGGFIIGGHYGEGALRQGGKTIDYYRSIAASYGLQIGAQSFAYVLMFLDDESLQYLQKSDGWELGVGPSVVVVDEGLARSLSTTTGKSGIYAFFFRQKGLMADISIQGSKITKFVPETAK